MSCLLKSSHSNREYKLSFNRSHNTTVATINTPASDISEDWKTSPGINHLKESLTDSRSGSSRENPTTFQKNFLRSQIGNPILTKVMPRRPNKQRRQGVINPQDLQYHESWPHMCWKQYQHQQQTTWQLKRETAARPKQTAARQQHYTPSCCWETSSKIPHLGQKKQQTIHL